MNLEDSVLEEKKKFSNFFSRFLKNSRVLIILLIVSVITAVSVSIWIKSTEYEILYDHLSNEEKNLVINYLNDNKIPYKIMDVTSQISIPKNKIDEIRLRFAKNNLPHVEGVGFELLDKEKFGISQFNEQINYQRALEGELSRTIQKINIVKNARIHIALPKSSLFLEDKKKPSASVVLELQNGRTLDAHQINAILHLIASSIANLSVEDVTIVDQFGNLLNQSSLGYDRIGDLRFKYSEEIESRYRNRINNLLEPIVGFGNVHSQVTAQIDFNSEEKTQEQYSPNSQIKNQSVRSRQVSIHDKTEQKNTEKNIPSSLFNSVKTKKKGIDVDKDLNTINHNIDYTPINSNLNQEHTINYELNRSVSHTKMNVGEIKRLSVAVVINFIKNKNGKLIPLPLEQIENIKNLIREAIGYSKSRGDSIHVVNASFAKKTYINPPIQLNNTNSLNTLQILFNWTPWFLSFLFFVFLLKKYICPFSKNNHLEEKIIEEKKQNQETFLTPKDDIINQYSGKSFEDDLNKDKLINQISNISDKNPRAIALIIRKWMSDKI